MACGQAREAKPWFRRAQALLRAHGLPEDFALAYFNLGLDFGWMKKLALGKAAFRRSTALYRQLGRKEELRQGQVLLGYTMVLLGELDAALPILMEAGRDLELLAPFDRVLLHLAEAELHLGQGRFAMAEEALARRFRVGSELEDPKVMADSLYRMAYLKNRLRDDWAVRTFLTEAQACIAGLGYPEAEARIMTFMQHPGESGGLRICSR